MARRKMPRPLLIGSAGLAALYLLTRNVSAQPIPLPSPYETLTRSQSSSFNAHLYTDTNNLQLSEAAFSRMMKDIAEIDGRRVMTWQTNFMNPTPIAHEINLAKAKIVRGNLESALDSAVNMSSTHRFVLQQWLDATNALITELEGTSSATLNVNGLGSLFASRATRRHVQGISGMKSWSKNSAIQLQEERRNSSIRDNTLARMQKGMDINLYQPLDTYEEEYLPGEMNSSEDIGSALVRTRNSMKRLL